MVVQNVKKNNSPKKDGGLKSGRVNKNNASLRTSNIKRLEGGKKISVGDICELKITALGPKGIGIDEYSFGYSVLVPNVKLGDQVKAKVLKVAASNSVKKLPKYAIAKVVAVTKAAENSTPNQRLGATVNPGEKLSVKISKITSKGGGIAQLTGNYSIVLPNTSAKVGETIEVAVTRAKANYAFAKEVKSLNQKSRENQKAPAVVFSNALGVSFSNAKEITEGTKISCVIPQKAKSYGKYYIVKFVKGTVLFIKKGLGAKPGSKVRLSITKATKTYYIANILQLNPQSSFKKHALVRNSLHQMIKNDLGFEHKTMLIICFGNRAPEQVDH
jgi:predicted RNA-binding protein with TRAM domain